MKRFLLFDSGCTTCAQIAKQIEEETSGNLIHRSLRESKIQEMLNQIEPNWQWEPMLLFVDEDDKPSALFRGSKMKLQFIRLIGFGKALSLYKKLQPQISNVKKDKVQQERRRFLQTASSLALGSFVVGVLPKNVLADENTYQRVFLPIISSQPQNASPVSFGVLSADEVLTFLKKARQDEAFQAFQRNLITQFPSLKLLPNKYQVLAVDEKMVVVNFEVESPTGYSSFELRYDKSTEKLIETHSFLAEYDESHNIKVRSYTNNEVVTDVSITEEGRILNGTFRMPDGRIISANEANAAAVTGVCGCYYTCLMSYGIPAWALSAIGAICGLVCACTAGVGCIACSAGVVYGYYVIFAMCSIKCWHLG